jgi:hypothetical protein
MPNIADIPSSQWIKYFTYNASHLLSIPWEDPYELTPTERRFVVPSIQQFELGEKSEGKTFLKKAAIYAAKHDPDYLGAVELFIKEEQRHSATLRRFLQGHHEPTLEKYWVDSIFRYLRKLFDIEMEVMVLLSAETIAMVYYRCLKYATKSPVMQKICTQILQDESQHINFQACALAKIHKVHPVWKERCLIWSRNNCVDTTL